MFCMFPFFSASQISRSGRGRPGKEARYSILARPVQIAHRATSKHVSIVLLIGAIPPLAITKHDVFLVALIR